MSIIIFEDCKYACLFSYDTHAISEIWFQNWWINKCCGEEYNFVFVAIFGWSQKVKICRQSGNIDIEFIIVKRQSCLYIHTVYNMMLRQQHYTLSLHLQRWAENVRPEYDGPYSSTVLHSSRLRCQHDQHSNATLLQTLLDGDHLDNQSISKFLEWPK